MRVPGTKHHMVLSIHPASRWFGYTILESPACVIDWGIKSTRRDKARKTLAGVAELLHHYNPTHLVLEDGGAKDSRRGERIQELLTSIQALAVNKGLRVRIISKQRVRKAFSAFRAQTREEVATIVADQVPELAPWLPRHRKPWMSEDPRLAMFDAAALALTYFYTRRVRSQQRTQLIST